MAKGISEKISSHSAEIPAAQTPSALVPLELAMQATPSSRSPPSWKEPPSTSRRASCFSFAGVKQRMVASVVGGSAADSESWAIADLPDNFYDLEAKTAKGEKYPFGDLRSKAVLVVNVASA